MSNERKSLEKFLFESLSSGHFNQVARLERNLFSYDFRLSREKLIKILENLRSEFAMNNPIYAPRFTPGVAAVNLIKTSICINA